jgi:drug/metabolite transporter (DMT)-like permease
MTPPRRRSWVDTACGLTSVLFWSITIGVTRSLSEALGAFTAPATIFTFSGIILLIFGVSQAGGLRPLLAMPWRHFVLRGLCFVGYQMLFFSALGTAKDHQSVLIIGIVNYLWPALIFVYSIPILRTRPRWWLLPGLLAGIAGVAVSIAGGSEFSVQHIMDVVREQPLVYVCAFLAPNCWALYTNFGRRFSSTSGDANGLPFYFLLSAAGLWILGLVNGEHGSWSLTVACELAAAVLLPSVLGYLLWDRGTTRGNFMLITACAYSIPVLSVIFSSLYLHVEIGSHVWIGSLLVIVGALICKFSIAEEPGASTATGGAGAEGY